MKNNNSLSLNDLRCMNGEPIWVKLASGKTMWCLVDISLDVPNHPIVACSLHDGYLFECDYGESWSAFRRPLKEDK